MGSRIAGALLALVLWAASGVVGLFGLYVFAGLRCDESCDGPGWRDDPDAWQWNALAGVSVTLSVVATAFAFALARPSRLASVLLAIHTLLVGLAAWGWQDGLSASAVVWPIAIGLELVGLAALRATTRRSHAATSA